MFKSLFIAVALSAAVLADTNFEKTTYVVLPKSGFTSQLNSTEQPTAFYIPPDNGGNYGDNLWRDRVYGDRLIITEIQINPISSFEQTFSWTANLPNTQITHIRFLNIGRERAWVESINSNGGATASAIVRIAAYYQFRLLIEVYGF